MHVLTEALGVLQRRLTWFASLSFFFFLTFRATEVAPKGLPYTYHVKGSKVKAAKAARIRVPILMVSCSPRLNVQLLTF